LITKFDLTYLRKLDLSQVPYWICTRCYNTFKAEVDDQQEVKELTWNHCPCCGRAITRVDMGAKPCHTK
jgi:hypothetical protein